MKAGLPNSRRHYFQRKGISLGELLIVMSAAMVILTISAALMHRIMHAYSKTRAFADVERTSLRLASAFRSDVHQATAATTTDPTTSDGKFLQLALAGSQRIEYRRDEGTIVRVLRDGDRLVSREAFAFSSEINVAVKKDGERLMVLAVKSSTSEATSADENPESPAYAVPVNLHVEAVLNRDSLVAATTPIQRGGQ